MKSRLIALVFVALLAGGGGFTYWHFYMMPREVADGQIRVSGNIETTEAQVSFKIPGRVVERKVDEGYDVETGADRGPARYGRLGMHRRHAQGRFGRRRGRAGGAAGRLPPAGNRVGQGDLGESGPRAGRSGSRLAARRRSSPPKQPPPRPPPTKTGC